MVQYEDFDVQIKQERPSDFRHNIVSLIFNCFLIYAVILGVKKHFLFKYESIIFIVITFYFFQKFHFSIATNKNYQFCFINIYFFSILKVCFFSFRNFIRRFFLHKFTKNICKLLLIFILLEIIVFILANFSNIKILKIEIIKEYPKIQFNFICNLLRDAGIFVSSEVISLCKNYGFDLLVGLSSGILQIFRVNIFKFLFKLIKIIIYEIAYVVFIVLYFCAVLLYQIIKLPFTIIAMICNLILNLMNLILKILTVILSFAFVCLVTLIQMIFSLICVVLRILCWAAIFFYVIVCFIWIIYVLI